MAAWLSNSAARFVLRGNTVPAIEPATARDAAALSALHRASFHRGWSEGEFQQMLAERNTLAHRLRLGEQTVGFIISRIAADEAEILSVAIAAKYRGRGLSGGLLRTHLGHLAGYGLKTVFLEVGKTIVRHARFMSGQVSGPSAAVNATTRTPAASN